MSMKLSAILAPLIAAKVPYEVILQTVVAYEEAQADALEKRRQHERDRQAKRRSMSRESRDPSVTSRDRFLVRDRVARVEDKTLTTDIEPQPTNKKRAASALDGFAEWYALYPHKVQRGAAEKAWPKARYLASQAELMAGLQRYIASKPPERHWLNPASWLNGRSWEDQPAPPPVAPMARAGPPRPLDLLNEAINRMDLADADSQEEAPRNPATAKLIPLRQSG